jgi:hypothetical protein
MKKLIEMVCTGNNGRSPVAELIGRNELKRLGAFDDYDTISSGTMVDKIGEGKFSTNFMRPYVLLAIGRGLYGTEVPKKLDTALREGEDEVVGEYFSRASELFATEEKEEGSILLKQYGIDGNVKEGADQTVPRTDVFAVLPMDRKNYAGVLRILDGSGQTPVVAVMSTLATQDPKAEVQNSFGQERAIYGSGFLRIFQQVPRAIQILVDA